MFNKLKALAVLSAFLTLVACSDNTSDLAHDKSATTASDHEHNVQEMYRHIDMLTRELPSVLDEVTTLEQINFDGTTVTFGYKLKISGYSDAERKEIETVMRNEHTKLACEEAEVIQGINRGFDYQYSYYDLDDIKVGVFDVTKDICDNLS
ncbi:hypothetical protein ACT3TI_08640 [Psychrobacter sp. AOP22-C1-22]|uniref:hypothetical protein n=1 Tax=unclassified Psychrobacter TaxID=196806 RepID=UPI001788311C|nr:MULTISPECIES: hypothetical protein [unclassified Psychrobacter]MBE0406857.1 hypothetical protein [Psychrobacter sp. FME6]MBE0446194.1 hypothetical protein [Psychrobacter sp. FME5]MDN5808696.1 hypothetical protein [Staphylococcus equorum]